MQLGLDCEAHEQQHQRDQSRDEDLKCRQDDASLLQQPVLPQQQRELSRVRYRHLDANRRQAASISTNTPSHVMPRVESAVNMRALVTFYLSVSIIIAHICDGFHQQ